MNRRHRDRAVFLAGFAVYFLSVWTLWYTPIVYPLKIFVVLLHEISHGIAAVASGGRIEAIVLDPAEGGACYCPGGNAFLTLSAGYLGSLGWGMALFSASNLRRPNARSWIALCGGVVLVLTAFYLRGAFALVFGVLFGGGLLAAARLLGDAPNRYLLRVLGLTSCLYVLLDIKSDVLDRPHLPSDAATLAARTGVPTLLWGAIWMLGAVLASAWLVRRSWART